MTQEAEKTYELHGLALSELTLRDAEENKYDLWVRPMFEIALGIHEDILHSRFARIREIRSMITGSETAYVEWITTTGEGLEYFFRCIVVDQIIEEYRGNILIPGFVKRNHFVTAAIYIQRKLLSDMQEIYEVASNVLEEVCQKRPPITTGQIMQEIAEFMRTDLE